MATTEVEEGVSAAPAAPAAAADEIKPYRIHVSLAILSLLTIVPPRNPPILHRFSPATWYHGCG